MPAWGELARIAYALRFRLLDRYRHQRLVLEEMDGLKLLVLPEVFHPALFHTSALLARALRNEAIGAGTRVLDLGCGSGFLALAAARRAAEVTAVDINPDAVRATRINALLNRLDHAIDVREGDLFAPVIGERFDLVLWNPPFLHGERRRLWDYAWSEPAGLAERFAASLPGHLLPNGQALIVTSSRSETTWAGILERAQLRLTERLVRVLATGEKLAVLEVGVAARG